MKIVCDRLDDLTQRYVDAAVIHQSDRVHNRKSFLALIDEEIARSSTYKAPPALCFIQIDGLDEISFKYGYQAESRILAQIGRLISDNVRDTDFVCQYDGRQFAVLTPGANMQQAEQEFLRLNTLVAERVFSLDSRKFSVTARFGLVPYSPDMVSAQAFLEKALQALNSLKSRGPN